MATFVIQSILLSPFSFDSSYRTLQKSQYLKKKTILKKTKSLLNQPQIISRNFPQILKRAGAAAELVVWVVLGHGDAVDVDVHRAKTVQLPVDHRPAHHLPSQHLHVLALVLSV